VFRYFNAAGAHESAEIGEIHRPETHLVPIVLESLAGLREGVTVHGQDYPTPDGTCVRDYVDVRDIARAHVLALDALAQGTLEHGAYNLGHGRGHSVLEVIRTCEAIAGRSATVVPGPRRPGDPPTLVAATGRAREDLGWEPRHDLSSMVEGAWAFLRRRAAGAPS
jgi:UDP-glucose 4-epimerase